MFANTEPNSFPNSNKIFIIQKGVIMENNNFSKTITSGNSGTERYEINIMELLFLIVHRLWIILLAGLIAALAAYFYTDKYITPTYTSTARVYILNRQSSNTSSANDLTSAFSLKEDFQVLVRSNEVYRQVLESIGEDASNYRSLAGKISLDNNTSRFVDITVTDADPLRAKILVDAIADVSRVRAKDIMGVEDITIEEYGTIATSPSSPSMSKNISLAFIMGVVLACGVILLIRLINNNIKTVEDVERTLGLCVLGSIPDVSTLSNHKHSHKHHRSKSSKKQLNR